MAAELVSPCTVHAIGHALGLEHEPGGLMAEDGYGGGVDAGTLARFSELYRY